MAIRAKEKQLPIQVLVESQFRKKEPGSSELQEGEVRDKAEIISVNKFVTEPARVSVDYGLTINLGNYETAKIGVSVTVPCYFEELDAAYKWAARWAETKVMAEQASIRKAIREGVEDQF